MVVEQLEAFPELENLEIELPAVEREEACINVNKATLLAWVDKDVKFLSKDQYIALAIQLDTIAGILKETHTYSKTDIEGFSTRWAVTPEEFFSAIAAMKKKGWAVTPSVQLTMQMNFYA